MYITTCEKIYTSSLKCKPDHKGVKWVEKKIGSLSPDHQLLTKRSTWIMVNRELEADLHHCQQQFVEERGKRLWDSDDDDDCKPVSVNVPIRCPVKKSQERDQQCTICSWIVNAASSRMPSRIFIRIKVKVSKSTYPYPTSFRTEKLYYASRNNRLFSSPCPVRNREELDDLLQEVTSRNLEQDIHNERPNCNWQIEHVTDVRVDIIPTSYPLGETSGLPAYLFNNQHIIALESEQQTIRSYNDQLCLFRYLAIGKYGCTHHNCNSMAEDLKKLYCQHRQMEEFDGVTLEDTSFVEKLSEVQIRIMSLKQDGTATTVYQTSTKDLCK